jgi:hypothetical protein
MMMMAMPASTSLTIIIDHGIVVRAFSISPP